MTNITFTTDTQQQAIVDNIRAIYQAIITAYSPDSHYYSPLYATVSPFPNPKHNIVISKSNTVGSATITIPINNIQAVFNTDSYILFDSLTSGEPDVRVKNKEKYKETLHDFFNSDDFEISTITKLDDLCTITIDISELNYHALDVINRALRVSGLKPLASAASETLISMRSPDKKNKYFLAVKTKPFSEEFYSVSTNLDFSSMERDELIEALKEKISINEAADTFYFINMENIESVELTK